MSADYTLLDNPIWHALNTMHSSFSFGNEKAKKYPAHILPFGGLSNEEGDSLRYLEPLLFENESLIVRTPATPVPENWIVEKDVVCQQMLCEQPILLKADKDIHIEQLGLKDEHELFTLVNSIQPGFCRQRTPVLGRFYGIKVDGQLIATVGERFKLNGFVEICAVCTHPAHTGKGLAQQLVTYLCNQVLAEGDIPFLHVENANSRAIRLYEFLGFTTRREIDYIKVKTIS